MVTGKVLETPLGWVGFVVGGKGLIRTFLVSEDAGRIEAAVKAYIEHHRALGAAPGKASEAVQSAVSAASSTLVSRVSERMTGYFRGDAVGWEGIPLEVGPCTDFQRRVLDVTAGIPHGQVRTYGWIAEKAGSPKAARAVGQVMSWNPLPIVIPCHRVVGAGNSLGGFAGGLELKKRLLDLEGVAWG